MIGKIFMKIVTKCLAWKRKVNKIQNERKTEREIERLIYYHLYAIFCALKIMIILYTNKKPNIWKEIRLHFFQFMLYEFLPTYIKFIRYWERIALYLYYLLSFYIFVNLIILLLLALEAFPEWLLLNYTEIFVKIYGEEAVADYVQAYMEQHKEHDRKQYEAAYREFYRENYPKNINVGYTSGNSTTYSMSNNKTTTMFPNHTSNRF